MAGSIGSPPSNQRMEPSQRAKTPGRGLATAAARASGAPTSAPSPSVRAVSAAKGSGTPRPLTGGVAGPAASPNATSLPQRAPSRGTAAQVTPRRSGGEATLAAKPAPVRKPAAAPDSTPPSELPTLLDGDDADSVAETASVVAGSVDGGDRRSVGSRAAAGAPSSASSVAGADSADSRPAGNVKVCPLCRWSSARVAHPPPRCPLCLCAYSGSPAPRLPRHVSPPSCGVPLTHCTV